MNAVYRDDRVARLICLIFGIADAIGIFWFQDTITSNLRVMSVVLVIFEISAGVIPVYKVRNIYQRAPYYLVCLGGIIFSSVFLYQAVITEYGIDWGPLLIRLVVIYAFIKLLTLNARASKNISA